MADPKSPPSEEAPKDYFNSLPNELLEQIADHLQLPDKLKFRLLMRKSDHEFITSITKEHFGRLYVCPTKRSLRNFGGICRSKFYNEHVREVIFVARSYDSKTVIQNKDELKAICQQRISRLRLDIEGDPEELAAVADGVEARDPRSNAPFLKWVPREAFVSEAFSIHQETAKQYAHCDKDLDSGKHAEELVDALELGLLRLPNLRSVAMVTQTCEAGLNRPSLRCYNPAPLGLIDRATNRTSHDIAISYAMDPLIVQTTGARAFYLAVSSPRLILRTLLIGRPQPRYPMPFGEANSEVQALASGMSFHGFARNLTSLHISHMDTSITGNDLLQYTQQWKSLAGSVPCLNELSIDVERICHDREDRGCRVIDIILRSGEFPHLTEFKVVGVERHGIFSRLQTDILFELLLAFLARHKRTVRSVHLDNILVRGEVEANITYSMRIMLGWMQRELDLESCGFRVRSYWHGTSLCCSQRGSSQCLNRCQSYRLRRFETFHIRVFEEVAQELGIEFEDGHWDFGKFVMQGGMPEQIGRELDEFLVSRRARDEAEQLFELPDPAEQET